MEVIKTAIDGVVIIEPRIFEDARGYFFESFSQREFDEKVCPVTFVQDNESKSSYGVMRGLHFQRPPFTQAKLVRCVKGAVLDVAVDIRKGSPTYGKHIECLLCAHDEEGERIAKQFEGHDFNGQCSIVNWAFNSSSLRALPTALPYSLRQQSSSISVMNSIIPKLMVVLASLMIALALIGASQLIRLC
jgi:dTDP-4-dehydrorhamnose 3,5-epimerase